MTAKALIFEAKHREGCACGFCSNKGRIGDWRKKKSETPKEPEPVAESEGEVKLSKGVDLGGPAARAYYNMTSKEAMSGKKPEMRIKMAGEVAGMGKSGQMQGFKNKGVGQMTSGKPVAKTRAGESKAWHVINQLLA